MWRDISELPEGEGSYLVWMSKPQYKFAHEAVLYRMKINNGYMMIINGLFERDWDGKPLFFRVVEAPLE